MDDMLLMIADGLNPADGSEMGVKERKEFKTAVSSFAFADFVSAFIAVLKFNASFLLAHVTGLFQTNSNGTSTQPALESHVSAAVQSTKS